MLAHDEEHPAEAVQSKPLDGIAVEGGDVSGDEEEDIVIQFDEGDGEDAEGAHCCICLEPYRSHNPPAQMRCGHHFHVPCLLGWQQRSRLCPLCQAPLDSMGLSPVPAPPPQVVGTVGDKNARPPAGLTAETLDRIILHLRAASAGQDRWRRSLAEAHAGPAADRVRLHLSIEAEMRRERRQRRRRSRERREARHGTDASSPPRPPSAGASPSSPDLRRGDLSSSPNRIEVVEVITEMNSAAEGGHRRKHRVPTEKPAEQPKPKPKPGLFSRIFGCCSSAPEQ
jgi:hypothetical protein